MIRVLLFSLALLLCWLPTRSHAQARARGVAVVAIGEAAEHSWTLTQALYQSPSLFPPALSEARARALITGAHTDAETAELAELRAGIHDEGVVSRQLLHTIGERVGAAAVLVARARDAKRLELRLFVLASDTFDVAQYEGDPTAVTWRGEVVRSLERRLGPAPSAKVEPTKSAKNSAKSAETSGSRPFYKSPWFWAALGGAALLGGTALVVSQVQSDSDVLVRALPPAPTSTAAFRGDFL